MGKAVCKCRTTGAVPTSLSLYLISEVGFKVIGKVRNSVNRVSGTACGKEKISDCC